MNDTSYKLVCRKVIINSGHTEDKYDSCLILSFQNDLEEGLEFSASCVVDKFLIASGAISFSSFCQLGHKLTDAAPFLLGIATHKGFGHE